jgi:cobalt/nickel transport system ATP-binding protein
VPPEEIIKIENLNFAYPDGRRVLRDITLIVTRGEKVALIGPNGAGKSTFLLHLNGILRQNGAVKILGQNLNQSNIKRIKSQVGMVFQNPDDQLFSPTVFDDVAFGPLNMGWAEERVRQVVKTALESVGMSGFEKRSPHHLSLGEKKRIAMATVLSMNPEILVFDEPSSNLDPLSRWGLMRLLQSLPVTQIIATHDLELVKLICARTLILFQGKIVADGPTAKILENKRLLIDNGLAPAQEML